MTTVVNSPQIVPSQPAAAPALRAADQGVPTPWSPSSPTTPGASTAPSGRFSTNGAARWACTPCRPNPSPLPATGPSAAGDGASIANLRLVSSAIAKAHDWAGHESPCRDQGVRASLKGWGRRLARPQRQAGALTADALAVIRLTAVQPRRRGRGIETSEQAPPSAPASTWPWWRRCPTPDCAALKPPPSPRATLSAGTTAAAASP